MQLRQFLKLATGVGALKVVDRAVGLALGVMLARWLDAEGYGLYAFVMGIVSMAMIAAHIGVPGFLMREIAATRGDPGRGDPRTLLVRGGLIVLGSSLILSVLGLVILQLLHHGSAAVAAAVSVGLVLLPISALLDVVSFALRGCQQVVRSQVFGQTIPALVAVVLVAVLALALHMEASPALGLAARGVGIGIGLACALVVLWRVMPAPADTARSATPGIRALLLASTPFMLLYAGNMILARTDVVMLGFLSSQRDVGLYNAAAQGGMLVQMVLQVSVLVINAEFARLHAAGDSARLQTLAVSTARVTALVSVVVALPLVFFGGPLMGAIFGPEFADGAEALAILAIGNLIAVAFGSPGAILTMTGHHKVALRLVICAAAMNATLNLLLIPSLGMIGAALATAASQIVWKGLAYVLVRRRLGIACAAFSQDRRLS